MKRLLFVALASSWLGAAPGRAEGGELLLESRPFATNAASPAITQAAWQAGGGIARCELAGGSGNSSGLSFRYAYETESNQTYLLRRQFAWWSNGNAQASITLSNPVSGDGTTRWETNDIVAQVDRHGFQVGSEFLAGSPPSGDLASVTYNEPSTPNLTCAYDRPGRLVTVTQDSQSNPQLSSKTWLTYNHSGLPVSESYSAGPLAGLSVTNEYDAYLRRTNLTLYSLQSVLDAVAYGYDSGARLKTVSQLATLSAQPARATYSYEPNAPLVQQVEFREGETVRLLCTRKHAPEGRPLSVAASPAASPVMTYEYLYDEAEQPARLTLADCSYDWRGRRIQKEVAAWNRSKEQLKPVARVSFVYDDWNLIAILSSNRTVLSSFAWGLELSPGAAGAGGGGSGGLLIIRERSALLSAVSAGTRQSMGATNSSFQPATYFAAFDGNGNLIGLANARDGTTAARYEYGPFGEGLPPLPPNEASHGFGFSTRYQDEETGLLYCGYRYYSPSPGRWLSREPLHEYAFWKARNEALELPEPPSDGTLFGLEEYVYVKNAPIGNIDRLGLAGSCDQLVRKALRSRDSQKLLLQMTKAGFPAPTITGADAEAYCSFPGYLGDYDCPSRRGQICCLNVAGSAEVARTVRHELVHAVDCARNGLETCHDHICSEVVAYYLADCERFVNRMECALGQMRDSMAGDSKCAPAAAAMSERSAWNCVQQWKRREAGR